MGESKKLIRGKLEDNISKLLINLIKYLIPI